VGSRASLWLGRESHTIHAPEMSIEKAKKEKIVIYFLKNKRRLTIKLQEGTLRMPRDLPAKKDVESCEKPRGAAKQALIRGCPNGETP
jgi:hypothetical protein